MVLEAEKSITMAPISVSIRAFLLHYNKMEDVTWQHRAVLSSFYKITNTIIGAPFS
jgi:hypothetical protein